MVAAADGAVIGRTTMIALIIVAHELPSQRTWLDPVPDNAVSVAVGTALFDDGITSLPTATVAFRGRVAVGDDLVLTAELPVGHARQESGLAGTALGLPWLGFEMKVAPWATMEFGGRTSLGTPGSQREILPYSYGGSLDFDRHEAWAAGASAVRVLAQLGSPPTSGRFMTGRIGAVGINAGKLGGDGRLFAAYAGRVGLAQRGWLGWVGVIGNLRVVEPGGSLGDRTAHQLEVALATRGRGQQLGVSLRRFVGEPFAGAIPLIVRLEAMVGGS